MISALSLFRNVGETASKFCQMFPGTIQITFVRVIFSLVPGGHWNIDEQYQDNNFVKIIFYLFFFLNQHFFNIIWIYASGVALLAHKTSLVQCYISVVNSLLQMSWRLKNRVSRLNNFIWRFSIYFSENILVTYTSKIKLYNILLELSSYFAWFACLNIGQN